MRAETIDGMVTQVVNLLWARAANSGDGFRQWFYPKLPKDYTINRQAYAEAEEMVLGGERDTQKIADRIYSKHA